MPTLPTLVKGTYEMSGRVSKSGGKGAAEEPEPEPDGSVSSSTTASYDPTVFQRPHPDDRGGGNGDGKPRKKGDGADNSKAKANTKTKDGKGKGPSLDRCGWCDTEGANKTCTQCRSVVYCNENCQKVKFYAATNHRVRLGGCAPTVAAHRRRPV